MIKVTELMINDWVSINGSNYKVKDIKKNGVIKLYEDTQWGEHEIDFNTDSIEAFLQPIPVTKEILEKNGFKKDNIETWRYHLNDGNDWFIYDSDNCILYRKEYNDIKEYYDYFELFQLKYVHEFQHALKLCKIEKEIIL